MGAGHSHRSVAQYLEKKGVAGPIRLISCEAGAENLAADLARKMKTTVEAATSKVGINTETGDLLLEQGGKWLQF